MMVRLFNSTAFRLHARNLFIALVLVLTIPAQAADYMVSEQIVREDASKAILKEFHKYAELKTLAITDEKFRSKSNPQYALSIETEVNENHINKSLEKYSDAEKFAGMRGRINLSADYARDIAGRKQVWLATYYVSDDYPPRLLKFEQQPCHRSFWKIGKAPRCVPTKAQVRKILEESFNEMYGDVLTITSLTKFDAEPISTFQSQVTMFVKLKADENRLDELPEEFEKLAQFRWPATKQEWTLIRDDDDNWSIDAFEHARWLLNKNK